MTTLALIVIAALQSAEKPIADTAAPAGSVSASPSLETSDINDRFMDDAQVRNAFESELNKPEYKRLRTRLKQFEADKIDIKTPSWWSRFWTWVGSWFRTKPARPGTGGPSFGGFGGGTIVVWILLGILLAILVAFIIKSASVRVAAEQQRKRVAGSLDTDAIQPSTPPGEIPSDEYMHRAMELARQGDNRRALRQLVLGGMSWIERAGLIRFRKGLTNRDYIRAIYRRKQQRKRFAGIILDFERVYFGRRDASDEQFQACLAAYKTAFSEMLDAEAAFKQQEAQVTKDQSPASVASPPDQPGPEAEA